MKLPGFYKLEIPSRSMDQTIQCLFEIARLPLLPYVAITVSAAYFGLAGILARKEGKEREAFFTPPPDLF
jgi:hypothetical protein